MEIPVPASCPWKETVVQLIPTPVTVSLWVVLWFAVSVVVLLADVKAAAEAEAATVALIANTAASIPKILRLRIILTFP